MQESCPCTYTDACHVQCSCAHPVMSAGCRRCCGYGSDEQRMAAAKRIVLIERIVYEALRRHQVGDFERLMPTSGHTLISLLNELDEL